MTEEERIAVERYNKGEKYFISTFIDEDTIILGYGKLYYDFEFPLPKEVVIKEFKTQSWREFFEIKGVRRYITTNLETNERSITPYFTEEELFEHKKINPNFKFEKL